jgi:two-component sensor histidine kinase
LRRRGEGDPLSLDVYIRYLAESIAVEFTDSRVNVECSIEAVSISMESTAAIGLIVSELITNSLKYAFDSIDSPVISISASRRDDNLMEIVYHDNGCGFPEDFKSEASDRIGMNLIRMQVKQMHGHLEVANDNGASFRMTVIP